LAAGFCPDPLGELMRSPRLTSRNGGLLLRGEREGEGVYFIKLTIGKEWRRRDGKGGEGIPLQIQGE